MGTVINFRARGKTDERARRHLFRTTGAYLAIIETLDHKEMVGVNPDVAHETMRAEHDALRLPKPGSWKAFSHRP
jgi:hypothetical protein